MKVIAVTSAFLLLVSDFPANSADPAMESSSIVAQVLGRRVTASDIGLKFDATGKPILPRGDPPSCTATDPVAELIGKVTSEVVQDYVAKEHLRATDEEIHEFQASQDLFMADDHARREKELNELQERIKSGSLNPQDREDAQKRVATLVFISKNEAIKGDLSKEDLRSIYAPFIEAWKFNKSVYERYGGTVAITKFGPDPVEATRRLLKDYERGRRLEIYNTVLRKSFWRRLSKPPHLAAKKNEISFTPFWRETKSQAQ
jgi:hypothetical protein